jgi:hypothetical protein
MLIYLLVIKERTSRALLFRLELIAIVVYTKPEVCLEKKRSSASQDSSILFRIVEFTVCGYMVLSLIRNV